MKTVIYLLAILCFSSTSCKKEQLVYSSGDIKINIITGEHWLHDFPLFIGIKKKNPPQFAIWLEDTTGIYLTTIFATYKVATGGWIGNKGNRRKEALPHWCHQRGIIHEDGLLLPTKGEPLVDGITGATPKSDKEIKFSIHDFTQPVVLKAEFNHSADYNDYYTEGATEGTANYSGGKGGSGQPAIIYAATLYPYQQLIHLESIGYSSPDGSDGNIYQNLNELTTAKTIVEEIKIEILK